MKRIAIILLSVSSVFCIEPHFRSLIVPGLGEAAIGNKKRAKFFLGTELSLLTTAIGTYSIRNQQLSDLVAYASIEAGIDLDARKDDMIFLVNVGNYDTLADYNDEKARQRDFDSMYDETVANSWDWTSDSSRESYDAMRVRHATYSKALGFVMAGMIVNRVVSFFDTMYLSRLEGNSNLESYLIPENDGLKLVVQFRF